MKEKEIPSHSACPCESGADYGACCKTQAFKWVRDQRGRVYQRIPLSTKGTRALKEYIETMDTEFRRVFRRPRRRGEPLDSVSYHERESSFVDDVVEAMEAADADPAWIYAFRKTGLLVTEMNERLMPRAELLKWRAAVTEYRSGGVRRREAVFNRALDHLFFEYHRYPFILGKFVGEAVTPRTGRSEVERFQRGYLFFCATKAVKTHRAVSLLVIEHLSEDLMSLARSIYETYLHMIWALKCPDDLYGISQAKIGLMTGTHEFKTTRNGRVNRRAIVEKRTGAVCRIDMTTSRLAQLSGLPEDASLHEGIYSLLSQHVHPDYRSAFHYLNAEGFSPREEYWSMPAVAIAMTVHLMVADALLQSPLKLSKTTTDLRRYLKTAKARFKRVTELAIESGATSPLPVLLQKRIDRVGQRWLRQSSAED